MTTTQTTAFTIHALTPAFMDSVRTSQVDVSGNPVEHLVAEGGEPLRCCLRDAEPDERLLLFGYEAPLPASPYREIGAVLAHADPCPGRADSGEYPAQWRGRAQVLRAYDERGWIHDATTVHDGGNPEAAITAIIAAPEVVLIHSRNVAWGCYMFSITRSGQPATISR
jgi:hypothetical protein